MAFVPLLLAPMAAAMGTSSAGAATLIGSATGAVGSVVSGIAGSNQANYQAQVADQDATAALQQGTARANQQELILRQKLAAGRAGALQNGIDLTGSMTDILKQTTDMGHLDFLTDLYEGQVQATGYRNNAAAARSQASNSMLGGILGAGSSLLGGMMKSASPLSLGSNAPLNLSP